LFEAGNGALLGIEVSGTTMVAVVPDSPIIVRMEDVGTVTKNPLPVAVGKT